MTRWQSLAFAVRYKLSAMLLLLGARTCPLTVKIQTHDWCDCNNCRDPSSEYACLKHKPIGLLDDDGQQEWEQRSHDDNSF